MSEDTENPQSPKLQVEPIWGVVANIVEERPAGVGGKDIRRGTRKFNAGQKVYFWDAYWGMGVSSPPISDGIVANMATLLVRLKLLT